MLRRLLLGAALLYVLVGLLLWLLQRRLQYFPDPRDPTPPEGVDTVTLEAADGTRLKAWHWPGERKATLVFLHGNAGHRGDRLEWARLFHARGWGIFLLDYRGYGGSGGRPTEEGLYADAEAAARWLEARGHGAQVYVGESLGCGVAVELARRRPPKALVLHAAAASLADVAQRAYPWLPVKLLMKDRYDALSRIGDAACPVLCVHGTDDDLIPMEMGRKLFDAAREPKLWLPVEGAGHNDLPWTGGRIYVEAVDGFLRKHAGP